MKNRTELLEEAITILDTLYDEDQDTILPNDLAKELDINPTISDPQYDMLRNELKKLNPNSEIFIDTTASKREITGGKVIHNPPMTSIEKASHEDREIQTQMLNKWIKDALEYGNTERLKDYLYEEYKLDGVALSVYYEDGKYVRAGTRPRDGINGEDVTENVKYINSVPQVLKTPITCSIRGEVICKFSDFEKVQEELKVLGKEPKANPRNHASGAIKQIKDPSKTKDARLTFVAYNLIFKNPPYKTEIEKAKFCVEQLGVNFIEVKPFNFNDLQEMEDRHSKLDYMTDGIVIGVNDLAIQENAGHHGNKNTNTPRAKIAWKFAEEKAVAVIKSIDWQVGRSGRLIPVANFDPVRLGGTNVKRATIHNYGFLLRKHISVGSKILLEKAGNIIPKIIGVVDKKPVEKDWLPNCPKLCPSCLEKTFIEQNDDMFELVCKNSECPARNVAKFEHYLKVFGVLGLGESKISALISGGKIHQFSDFYKLSIDDIAECGLTGRQALLILASIYCIEKPTSYEDAELEKMLKKAKGKKIEVPAHKLFSAFGVESAGKSAGKELEIFGSFDKIRNVSVEDLTSIDGIGEKTANLICSYFAENKKQIDELLLFLEVKMAEKTGGKLSGKSVVFTGSLTVPRKEFETMVEEAGGKNSSTISKNTTYLVVGDAPGSKLDKAQQLGTVILSEEEFLKLL